MDDLDKNLRKFLQRHSELESGRTLKFQIEEHLKKSQIIISMKVQLQIQTY